jgi:hypothetical protein
MATIAAVAAIGAAGFSAWSSGKSAKKQQAMIKAQIAEAQRIREENKGISNKAFDDIIGLIDGTKSIGDYLTEGEKIGQAQLDYRMKYVLGDTEDDVRDAQRINANLASYDFADVNKSISDLIKSNLYNVASLTRDSPSGSFANLSVQNMAALSQQGLANTINTGDFIGRISGIDQYTPYRIAQDLFSVERDKSNQKIQAETNRSSQIIGTNNQWFSNFSKLSSASQVVEATRNAAMISAVNSAAGAIGGYGSAIDSQKQQNTQNNYMQSLLSKYSTAG